MSNAAKTWIGDAEIRSLQEVDVPSLALLMMDMQAHYRVPCPPLPEVEASISGRPVGTDIFVACSGGLVVAFAAFAAIFPGPGLRPGLFLKELYVGAAFRGRGLGRRLLREGAKLALDRGYSRIDWTADRNDERLLSFYRDLGGVAVPDKLFFRLNGEGTTKLAKEAI